MGEQYRRYCVLVNTSGHVFLTTIKTNTVTRGGGGVCGCYNRRTYDAEQKMKGIITLSAVLALGGCVSASDYVAGDFTYEDISDSTRIGVRATSSLAGMAIDVFGLCTADERQYFIDPTSMGPYRPEGNEWTANIDGGGFWRSEAKYDDEASFIASLSTLEVISPPGVFGGKRRIKVANQQMERITALCNERQDQALAYVHDAKEKERRENERLISDVVNRTGVKPMLGGDNHKDLNNLALLFRATGTDPHEGKFVWAEAGDYETVQIMDGKVLMLSRFSPSFPAVIIFTDTKPPKGKSSFSLFKAPLKLIGTSTYETVLGESRQAIMFKAI